MDSILDDFINKLKQAARDAIGSYGVMKMGVDRHQQTTSQYPTGIMIVGAGPPTQQGVRKVKYSPTNEQIQTKLQNNSELILELFLTEIIQNWFDFLADIYVKAVENNLSGVSQYPIPIASLKLDLTHCNEDLLKHVLDSSSKYFDFLSSKEKLNVVKKILGADMSNICSEMELLKTNIQVRNILQHQAGIVSDKDLNDLGVSFITEDHGNSNKNIYSNQRVTRTAFDIENLVDAIEIIANTLIN